MSCFKCPQAKKCSEARRFAHSHNITIKLSVDFATSGLYELYGETEEKAKIIKSAFALIERARKRLGFIYAVKNSIATVFLKESDIRGEIDKFVYNGDTHYYEMSI